MHHKFRVLLSAAALCGGLIGVAKADATAPLPAPLVATPTKSEAHFIPIKNVPPSLIASWLDPKNNPLPKQFQLRPHPSLAGVKDDDLNSPFALPTGVERIVPIDPQNSLMVIGTEAGFQKLAETVAFLDKPLRQVEIEAQWVQVSPEDARAFGIDYPVSQGNFTPNANAIDVSPKLGFVRGNYQATLAQLVKQKRAKVLTAPRITAINNLSAALSSFAGSSATVNFQGNNDAHDFSSFFAGTNQVGIEYSLGVTPTINNDDTITVLLSTSSKLKIRTGTGDELVSGGNREALETIVNARDGQTVALGSFFTRTLPTAPNAPKTAPTGLIIFVTTRIVRRAEDDVKPVALRR